MKLALPALWIYRADGEFDGLAVGGASVSLRPSLLAREQRLWISSSEMPFRV
jgi:hypothetical protein